jgi:hypothetical protein
MAVSWRSRGFRRKRGKEEWRRGREWSGEEEEEEEKMKPQ